MNRYFTRAAAGALAIASLGLGALALEEDPASANGGSCTVAETESSGLWIEWTTTLTGEFNIRRNGEWLATTTEHRYASHVGSLDDTWTIRHWDASTLTEIPCVDTTPRCRGLVATIVGTDGPDVLVGTHGPDVIFAGAGDDRITGNDGDDIICAGPGADHVDAGAGRDTVLGGSGADTIRGGSGDDLLRGGNGADVLDGEGGRDRVNGQSGNDTVIGGRGKDRLLGGPGRDLLSGGVHKDRCAGNGGTDVISPDCEIVV